MTNQRILARPPAEEAHLDLAYRLTGQGEQPTAAKSEFEFHPKSGRDHWEAAAIVIQENLEAEDCFNVEAFVVMGEGHYQLAEISIPSAFNFQSYEFTTFADAVRFARFAWSVWHSGRSFKEAGMKEQHRH